MMKDRMDKKKQFIGVLLGIKNLNVELSMCETPNRGPEKSN